MYSSESATAERYSALESRVRHCPSDGGLDAVEDDDVGVQLGIAGAGVPVVERRRDDPSDVAWTTHPPLPTRVANTSRSAYPMTNSTARWCAAWIRASGDLVGERPRDRDALGDRERQVEPRHGLGRLTHPPEVVDDRGPRPGRWLAPAAPP